MAARCVYRFGNLGYNHATDEDDDLIMRGGRLTYYTLIDPDLPHQVVMTYMTKTKDKGEIAVSCNCQSYYHKNGVSTHRPMGTSSNLDESRELYNRPENHYKPFTEKDKAKW